MEHVETIVIGAGQAGLALSHELTALGRDHLVLERGRVGERWRSERWDSLALLTPNWLNRLPGAPPHADPDGFLSRDGFVGHLERYARSFGAPVVEGATVLSVTRGYVVRTDVGEWRADNVVVATGAFDVPHVPAAAQAAPVEHLHVARYRNPGALAPG
ncbi:MAG: NAD(P)-binding domain-containing protein, partial [Actinomycetota bacterium]|nr:NAD(P)-binding domain-containing protein [Actinomycetota bacterium]